MQGMDELKANLESPLGLREQIANDLADSLSRFQDPRKGLRVLSDNIGIHQKTLKRLLAQENTPGYLSLYKIYRYLLATTNDTKLLELVPEVVRAELIRGNPKDLDRKITFSMDVEHEIATDKVFCEIYFLTNTGAITEEFVQYRFGTHGKSIMNKMIELKVLKRVGENRIVLGENQANLSTETIKRVGLHLTDKYFHPDRCDDIGENFTGIYVEGLTKEGYNEWLRVDQEAFYKKVELAKTHKSEDGVRAFTFMATDSMSEKRVYENEWN